jgi:lysylphosphatidylglycerol synthetase-like protein (DUF2156 family)
MNALKTLPRAFSSNLRTIAATPAEQAELGAQGITDPTIGRFVLWRRATVLMVVIATVLSAAVSTVSTFTESEDEPDAIEALTETISKKLEPALPAAAPKPGEEAAPKPGDETPTAADEADDGTDSPEENEGETALGRVVDGVHLLSLYAMPVAALIVLYLGRRFKLAFRVMVIAFLFSFFAPMLIAVCPWSWWGYVEPEVSAGNNPNAFLKDQAEGVMEAAAILLQLLPAVLSLIPGVQRACLRVKTLLPESSLPGWLIVVVSPLYGLFLLVIFVAVDQFTSQPAVLSSLALLTLASLFYVFRPGVFTRPLLTDDDYRRMRGVQRIVGLITLLAGVILITYLFTSEIMGVHLVGSDPKTSLMRPIEVVELVLEVIGRSMFVTALGADLIMRMNLLSWRHQRTTTASEAAPAYHGAMGALETIV